jgi:hypothetical protein
MLFAQAAGGGGGTGPSDDVIVIVVLVASGVTLVIWLAVYLLFLMTLARALRECHPRNRRMEPGQVYLNLIPLFSLVWRFNTVNALTYSLREEFADRGLRRQGDYGNGMGTAYATLAVCVFVPYVGSLLWLASAVFGIVYWVKIAGLLRTLRESESHGDDEDREARERYYDDRDDDEWEGRRRRRRSRYEDEDDEDDRPRRRWRDDD